MKKILIINTGGTISSVKSSKGYYPKPGFVSKALTQIPELKNPEMPSYELIEYKPLLDSSNMRVQDWNRLGNDIAKNYHDYDGFVIFHGTDTMAYTASALSFMLENLKKPVVITGSQIPMSEIRNDAKENVIASLWIAAHLKLNEVCIYFNQRLLRGNRSQKVNSQGFNAFDSPNYPHLAKVGINIECLDHLLLEKSRKRFQLQTITPNYIANFRIFPGFSTEVLTHILEQPLKGLILESYGIGNAQNNDANFLHVLKSATKRGIVIVNCTQCHKGEVNMDSYATGKTLKKAGLISGYDMTPEAAHCKLLYLFSKELSLPDIKKQMQQSLRGELC